MRLTDGRKTVSIAIRRWDGNQYGPDWSEDYFGISADRYDAATDTYTVDDVDYCIDMANGTDEEGARVKYDPATDRYVEDEDVQVFVEAMEVTKMRKYEMRK